MIPGVDRDPEKDSDHIKSLAFSVYDPWAFCIFWVAAIIWTTIRVIVGF
jgi:low affinity Fe/Cu permease